jgi:hypothetical protein
MKIRELLLPHKYKLIKYLPWLQLEKPIFILGCGRSGTTIIGKSLSYHPDVAYMNEPRRLWSECYPETDIWSQNSKVVCGRMVLTDMDVKESKTKKLKALLEYEMRRVNARVLVEKTPVNNYRTSFIQAMFPQAKYICIFRNGLEVARSIEKIAARGLWFGYNDYKWNEILSTAQKLGVYPDLVGFPRDDFERGLLEWRVSNEMLLSFLNVMPTSRYLSFTYSQYVEDPVNIIRKVLKFIKLKDSADVTEFLRKNVSRKTKKRDCDHVTERNAVIGGELLFKLG